MVDRGVKYRIMLVILQDNYGIDRANSNCRYAKRCCPTQVAASMYMWHPDGVDGFDDYFGTTSRFSEVRNPNVTWTTTINLSYWGFLSASNSGSIDKWFDDLPNETKEIFDEARASGDFPPDYVRGNFNSGPTTVGHGLSGFLVKLWQRIAVKNSPARKADARAEKTKLEANWLKVEERSSCLVITGDEKGRFWTCSVWSSLLDEGFMATHMTKVSEIMKLFVHQLAVSRSMVFIFLLGHTCEKLADEYKFFLGELEKLVKLGVSTLLEPIGHV
jgi:hypothetical protein